MFKVAKLSGEKQDFKSGKISESIWLAAKKVGGENKKLAYGLGRQIALMLRKKYPDGEVVSTAEIGELVEKILVENGHVKTAREFIRHRENKKHLHQNKESLGVEDDIGLSYNTLYILKKRYLKRTQKGEIVETPKKMIERVAYFLSKAEQDRKKQEKWYKKFYAVMVSFEFLPGTRPLANAGKKEAQLSNCFVWPVEDDIDSVFNILHKSTLIKKYGGGCGYNFSRIRPRGDVVGGIPELAAGPLKIVEMFDLMTSLFKQEGNYESGNMAVLNSDHPDIFNFISAKQTDGYLSKTNISVGITDEFMKAALKDKDWDLINPRTGEVVNTTKAKTILNLMARMAWQTGDPGILNLSAINKGNRFANPLLKKKGPIVATNVCGEIPQYPFESCNLGYVNFTKFVKKEGEFDFKRLNEVVEIGVRLMDNVIESSWFPVPEVSKAVRDHRRVGIGCVGWAETLSVLGIPYDSRKARDLAEKIVKNMYKSAFNASCRLAEEKGPFPLINDSIWANRARKPRNVALLTFPPSSGNAVICETSFGIEPFFALAYEQNVMDGMRLKNVVPAFIRALQERGIYSETLIQKVIDNNGSCQGIDEVPKDIQNAYKIAHDISWKDHIRIQASFQKWTDNAITKTVNMPASSTPDDFEEAFVYAWKLGCKGLTLYRDKSKSNQVIRFGFSKKTVKKCPECKVNLVRQGKCSKCRNCEFSSCDV